MNKTVKRSFILLPIFTIIAIVVHHLPVPLLFGINIYFSDIVFLSAIRLIGLPYAIVITLVTSLVGLWTGGSVLSLILSVAKVVIIGLLWKKGKKDLLTWSFVYIILYLMFYPVGKQVVSELSSTIFHFVMLKEIVSLLFCALVADIISSYLPFVKGFRKIFESNASYLYFGKIISHIIMFAAIFPLLLVVFVVSKSMVNDMYQTLQNRLDSFERRVTEEAVSFDLTQIMEFRLESDLQKANLHAVFTEFIGDRSQQVILFNKEGEAWLKVNGGPIEWDHKEEIQSGIGKPLVKNGIIYMDDSQESIEGWQQSVFLGSTSMISSEALLIVPLEQYVLKIINQLHTYLVFLLVVILVAILLTVLINNILTKSISHITNLTTNLPVRMKQNEALHIKETKIKEFGELANNIKQVATELRHMFSVIERKNKQLTEKTDQLMESENKLFRLAHYDSLTLLGNRNKFYEDLKRILRRSEVNGQEFALFFIDMDKFKEVNDTYGHQVGDLLLKKFGKLLLDLTDKHSEFTPYRLAGDEFIAIYKFTSVEDVTLIRKALEHICEQPIVIGSRLSIYTTASIGVSFYPKDGTTIDELVHQADQKMYERKLLRQQDSGE